MATNDSLIEKEGSLFYILPDEIKLRILHYLDSQTIRQSVALTSKDFHKLTKDRSLYELYETPKIDAVGLKTQVELNNSLYRSHLKVLCTSSSCLELLDLIQLRGLENIILRNVCYPNFPSYQLKLPRSDCMIEVGDKHFAGKYIGKPLHRNVSIKVDVICINQEEDLKNMFNVSADRYLINTSVVASSENLQRLLTGDLRYLLEMENVRFYYFYGPCSWTDLLSCVPEKLSHIDLNFDCSDLVQRQTVLSVCQYCTCLEYFRLGLGNISELPKIEKVACGQLQTLILAGRYVINESTTTLKRCELLIEAARCDIHFIGLKSMPLEILSYMNASVSSLLFNGCDWSSDSGKFEERKAISNVTLVKTPIAPILQRIDVGIAELSLNFTEDQYSADALMALKSMNCLEVFSVRRVTITLHEALDVLLASKRTLRVFKFNSEEEVEGDARQTLRLLRQFQQLQYFEIVSHVQFTTEEVNEFYPTAIVRHSLNPYNRTMTIIAFL